MNGVNGSNGAKSSGDAGVTQGTETTQVTGVTGRWSGERGFTIAVFGLSLGLLVATLTLGQVAQRVPILVVIPIVVLTGIQLAREFSGSAVVRDRPPVRWAALAWIGALPVAIYLAGLFAGAGLFTMIFVRFRGRDSWWVSLSLAAGVVAGAWILVGVLIGSTAPTGALWEFILARLR